MRKTIWIVLSLAIGGVGLTGCAPLIGAGAIVAADELAERDGDDGLF
ncbi:hypothetical protein ACQ5SP_05170 [Rhodovulum sp. YNF3179]